MMYRMQRLCLVCEGTGEGQVENADLGGDCRRCVGTGVEPNPCPAHQMFRLTCDDCRGLRKAVIGPFMLGEPTADAEPPSMEDFIEVDEENAVSTDEMRAEMGLGLDGPEPPEVNEALEDAGVDPDEVVAELNAPSEPGTIRNEHGDVVYDEEIAERRLRDYAPDDPPSASGSRTRNPRGSAPEDGVAEYVRACFESYSLTATEIAGRREEKRDDVLAAYELGRAEAYDSAAAFIERHLLDPDGRDALEQLVEDRDDGE